jgi:hypothetical protein
VFSGILIAASARVPARPYLVSVPAASLEARDVVHDIGVADLAATVDAGVATAKHGASASEAVSFAAIKLRPITLHFGEQSFRINGHLALRELLGKGFEVGV